MLVELDDELLELLDVPGVLAGAPVELDVPPVDPAELPGALVEVLADEELSSVEIELSEMSELSVLSVCLVLSLLSGTLLLTTDEGSLLPPPLSEFITKNPPTARAISTMTITTISGAFDLLRGEAAEAFL